MIDRFNYDEVDFSQESLTAALIIVSNATKKNKNEKRPKTICHRKCQETPLLIYSSLEIYSTCNWSFLQHWDMCLLQQNIGINTMFLQKSYYSCYCFFPKIPKKGILTIMMKYNIDMNARSMFIKSHYYGTSSSIV